MGGGYSTYANEQTDAYYRQERERKRAIKEAEKRARQAEKEARKAEREARIQSQRGEAEESRWWQLGGWVNNAIKWPWEWWKRKRAWEREETKRTGEEPPDHEWVRLKSAETLQTPQDERTQGSGRSDGEL